jgi:threonylcarbamoyladenosine tRNA methylthiotransferase CDKAL1
MFQFLLDARRQQLTQTWFSVAFACGAGIIVGVAWHVNFSKAKLDALPFDVGTATKTKRRRQQRTSKKAGEADEDSAPDLEDINVQSGDVRKTLLGVDEVRRAVKPSATPENQDQDDGHLANAHVPGAQRVHVKIYGCQHNQSDGEYMLGQLRDYGYTLVDTVAECDVCVINSCTVKNPSESRGLNAVREAREAGKAAVLTGCVPSGDKKLCEASYLDGVSMLDVSQLDRIVEVVEESLKGHTVKLLDKRHKLTSLSLPKIRRDNMVEIIPINVGCFGNCSYCKTKFARGSVVSHPINDIVERAKQVASEGVRMIELASEDMGAYGIDLGTNIVELLLKLSDQLPEGVMVRTGMTNPPYILQHIDGMIEALNRPNIFTFMHIPVQSGSDNVLRLMKRDYTVAEFSFLCDRLRAAIPDIYLITDIICGFPAESDEDWKATMDLVRKYRFHGIYSSKFFARPGTPAHKMKQQKAGICSERYKQMVEFASSWNRNEDLEGREERVWFYSSEAGREQTVGRTKAFAKVVVPRDDSLVGRSAVVRIGKTCVSHVEGEVLGNHR